MIAFWLSVLLTRQYKRLLGLILLCMQNTQYFVPSLVRCRNMKSQLHTTTSSYMGYKGCKPGVCVFSLSPLIHNVFIHSDASTVYTHRNTQTRLTESSGGLCILIHSTDGPFTCRNLWKRFLKPSKSFLDTWKTQFFYLFIFFILFYLTFIYPKITFRPISVLIPSIIYQVSLILRKAAWLTQLRLWNTFLISDKFNNITSIGLILSHTQRGNLSVRLSDFYLCNIFLIWTQKVINNAGCEIICQHHSTSFTTLEAYPVQPATISVKYKKLEQTWLKVRMKYWARLCWPTVPSVLYHFIFCDCW